MIVISRIVGGIGNQLFQYAASIAFAKKYKGELYLDLSTYSNPKYFNYGFLLEKVFNVKVFKPDIIKFFKVLGPGTFLLPLRFRINYQFICNNYFWESGSPFKIDDRFNSNSYRNCYLEGHWQSEEYFKDFREELIKAFTFKQDCLTPYSIELGRQLRSENSVSIHVRRGDYITDDNYKNIYAECGQKYFTDSMKFVNSKIPNTKFYVFSDDIEWAESQPFFNGCNFINNNKINGDSSVNDLYLMSCCKHNIIANSSFSWWGAWLNNNSNKIVVAPKVWFKKNVQPIDLIPKDWKKI